MLRPIGRFITFLKTWMGSWPSLMLLVVVVLGVAGGLLWERNRHPAVPPEAQNVATSLTGEIRQTTFRYPGSIAMVKAFYQQTMLARGWRYCGTQATANCSNMIQLVDRPGEAIDVYRNADDQNNSGPTVEIWPITDPNGQTFVIMYETRSR